MNSVQDVLIALRSSEKGRLQYDRYWQEEGRTQEILDSITSQSLSLSISPKALSVAKSPDSVRSERKSESKTEDGIHLSSPQLKNGDSLVSGHIDDIYFLQQQSERELPILEYEREKSESVQQLYGTKREEYEAFSNYLVGQIEKQYQLQKQKLELEALRKAAELQQTEQFYLQEYETKQDTSAKKDITQVFKNTVEATPAAEDASANQLENGELQEKLELYNLHQRLLMDVVPEIESNLRAMDEANGHVQVNEWILQLTKLVQSFSLLLLESTNSATAKAQAILDEAQCLLKDTTSALGQAKAKESDVRTNVESSPIVAKAELNDSHIIEAPQKSVQEGTIPSTALYQANQGMKGDSEYQESYGLSNVDEMEECDSINDVVEEQPKSEVKAYLAQFIDPEASRNYCNIIEKMEALNASLEPFRTDPKYKKYRLELHKAVAINTVSDSSGAQLKDKIRHLISLLSGQSVEVGGKYTSCKHHPLAVNYCKNLLAEKLVTQGEEQVQSKIAAAFPFATVAVTLCLKFPEIWDILLGHFYFKCPYLVPFYPPKEDGQSDDDHCISLGYKYINNKLEEKTNFLKRMTGFVTLYAAIIQTNCAPGFVSQPSLNLEHGWTWLARCLNMDPRPDVTATVLLAFLEVVGHALMRTYDKQFRKLLHIICKEYFPKIEHVTPPTSGGPIGRLKDFLHLAVSKGHISQPEGILNTQFWRT